VVGVLLIVAAWQMARLARSQKGAEADVLADPPLWPAMIAGAAIGFAAGVTGIGGGIFIAPLVLWLRWLGPRHTAGLSALFNLLNSAAALAGLWGTTLALPGELPVWLAAAAVGAAVGSWLGVKHLAPRALRYILAALLLVGGVWMLVGV
jgi:uncharacterized membrane protein YfcA